MIEKTALTIIFLLSFMTNSFCQEAAKLRPSPMASISMRYKDAYIKIVYSQPQKKEREIFGSLVPYGEVWRLGANEATELTTTRDILINNQVLKAGTYSIFAIPEKERWTVIVNNELGLWGAYNYNVKMDVMRFEVPVSIGNVIYEPFTMEFIQKNELADLLIRWDNVKLSVPLKFLN
jgi:hypothetical protein